jgi:hypothetical protein
MTLAGRDSGCYGVLYVKGRFLDRHTQFRRNLADIVVAELKIFVGGPVLLHQRNARFTDFCNVGMIVDAAADSGYAALPGGNFLEVHIDLRRPLEILGMAREHPSSQFLGCLLDECGVVVIADWDRREYPRLSFRWRTWPRAA